MLVKGAPNVETGSVSSVSGLKGMAKVIFGLLAMKPTEPNSIAWNKKQVYETVSIRCTIILSQAHVGAAVTGI